jgi:hypothetical protein
MKITPDVKEKVPLPLRSTLSVDLFLFLQVKNRRPCQKRSNPFQKGLIPLGVEILRICDRIGWAQKSILKMLNFLEKNGVNPRFFRKKMATEGLFFGKNTPFAGKWKIKKHKQTNHSS